MWMVPTPKQHFLQWQQSESHSHVAVRGELNLLGPQPPCLALTPRDLRWAQPRDFKLSVSA